MTTVHRAAGVAMSIQGRRIGLFAQHMAAGGKVEDTGPSPMPGGDVVAPGLCADYAGAATTVQKYFDASHGINPEALRPYFKATLKGIGPDGVLSISTHEEFMGIVTAPKGPEFRTAEMLAMDKILSMEQTSKDTILCKVQVAAPSYPLNANEPVVFTDFLSLIRVQGEWIIASKVFAWVPMSAPFEGYGYEEDNDMTVAHREIAEQLQHYIQGGSSKPNEATLRKVFHPSTVLKGVSDGHLVELESEAFLSSVGMHEGEPISDGQKYNKILRIDKAGKDVAAATVMVAAGGQIYMDHLSLLKLEGQWMIVHKTFAGIPLDEAGVVEPSTVHDVPLLPIIADYACAAESVQKVRNDRVGIVSYQLPRCSRVCLHMHSVYW